MKRERGLALIAVPIYLFMLLPVPVVLWMSLTASRLVAVPPDGYSLRWYRSLPESGQLMAGLRFSLVLGVIVCLISVTIGTAAALALAKKRTQFGGLFRTAFLVPLIVPSIILSLAIYVTYFALTTVTGIRFAPSMGVLVAGHVLVTLPWTFRIMYSAIQNLNPRLDDASHDLGRSSIHTLVRINLPLLRPALSTSAIFAFIFSFGNLEISLFLTEPGRVTLPVAMIQYARMNLEPTLAAVGTVQILLMAGLMYLASRFVNVGRVVQES